MSLIPITRAPDPPPAVVDTTHVSDALLCEVNVLLRHCDRIGLGNTYLRVLFRPGEDKSPSPDGLFLSHALPYVLGHLLDVPAELLAIDAYPKPYLDAHVTYRDRTSWQKGLFVHLVVTAYGLGGSVANPPPPHGTLLPYYRQTGAQQMHILVAMAQEYERLRKLIQEREARAPKPEPQPAQLSEAELRSLVQGMVGLNMDEATVRREVLATLAAARQGTPRRTLTQEDFFRR